MTDESCAKCGERPETQTPYCDPCWIEEMGCPHKWDVAGLWICMYDDNDFQCKPRVERGDCPLLISQSKGEDESNG